MAFRMTDDEYRLVENLPEEDIIDLAVELDIPVGEVIDRRSVMDLCVVAFGELAQREGLPFSEYDREDLEALPAAHLAALARQLDVKGQVNAILRAGRKVYKVYRKHRERSQIPMVLPSLLGPVCRQLDEKGR
jgi:hypothetical protein